MKKLVIPMLVLLLLLSATAPVAAEKPVLFWENHDPFDFLMVDCVPYGYEYQVWDRVIADESETGYFDSAGVLVRTLVASRGTDNLYLSTAPGVILASGPFSHSGHVDVIDYEPFTVQAKWVGTAWNVQLPDGQTFVKMAGQQVYTLEGYPPAQTLISIDKWVGHTVYDEAAICAAFD